MTTSATPVTPITQQIPTLSPAPNRQTDTEDQFSDKADTFASEWEGIPPAQNIYSAQTNTIATQTNANAQASFDNAVTAESASNLVGNWADQTGALNKPASVAHVDTFWGLLNNLADVTTSEPGVTSDWQEIKTAFDWGAPITGNGTITLGDGELIDVAAANVTRTYPTTLVVGQRNKFTCFDTTDPFSGNLLKIDPGVHTLVGPDGFTVVDAIGDGILDLQIGDSAELVVIATGKIKVV